MPMIPSTLGDITIRYLERKDADAYISLEKDEGIKQYIGGPNKKSYAEIRSDINAYVPGHHLLAIASTDTDHYLGRCGYLDTERDHEKEVYLLLGQTAQNKGHGTRVVKFLKNLVSAEGYNPIAYVDPDNLASRRLFKSLEWTKIGVLSKSNFQNGHFIYAPLEDRI